MAISFPVDYLNEAIMALIEEHCIIKPKADQYNENPEAVNCFNIDDETNRIYIPMGMWKLFYDKFPVRHDYSVNDDLSCSKELYTLETDPKKYRDQDVVFDKALHKLQKNGVVFLNLNTGYGKCLAPKTEVLMFDGTKKYARDVEIDDQLMGDDSSPRNVTKYMFRRRRDVRDNPK